MSTIINYAGIEIDLDDAVRLAGDGDRWAHRDDENICQIEDPDGVFEYALTEETNTCEDSGDLMHNDRLRYVEFNDAYTSSTRVYTLYGRHYPAMEYIPACEDHATDCNDNDCHPDDIEMCDSCCEDFHRHDIDDGRCSNCYEEKYGNANYVQPYHDHELADDIEVHRTPEPDLKKAHRQRYTIGFEVEKSDRSYREGDEIPMSPLFAYWESDGSCGIEGVTHAYSLGSSHIFHQHVSASERLLNMSASSACGGHLSVKGPNLSIAKVRKYVGLLYTLHRGRLLNSYCSHEARLLREGTTKYSPITSRGTNFLEFRLPRAVKSAAQLRNRYEFMQLMADAIHEEMTFKQYLRSNRSLLRRLYPEVEERRKIYAMARHFQDWVIEGGTPHPTIARYAQERSSY